MVDESYISSSSTAKNSINTIKKSTKKVKEEIIITDEPYLEYYKKPK